MRLNEHALLPALAAVVLVLMDYLYHYCPWDVLPSGRAGGLPTDFLELWPSSRTHHRRTAFLELFIAPRMGAARAAVVLVPGGCYGGLWMGQGNISGPPVAARWFNDAGISAFVLNYRLPAVHGPHAPLQDATRAVQLVKNYANKLGLNPDNIGIMGYSAGGHVAAGVGLHYDHPFAQKPECGLGCKLPVALGRPGFVVLDSSLVSMMGDNAPKSCRDNLLGLPTREDLAQFYSLEKHVGASAPPLFAMHSEGDCFGVKFRSNSALLAAAYNASGLSAEVHLLPGKCHCHVVSTGELHPQCLCTILNSTNILCEMTPQEASVGPGRLLPWLNEVFEKNAEEAKRRDAEEEQPSSEFTES
eukprot:RCo005861